QRASNGAVRPTPGPFTPDSTPPPARPAAACGQTRSARATHTRLRVIDAGTPKATNRRPSYGGGVPSGLPPRPDPQPTNYRRPLPVTVYPARCRLTRFPAVPLRDLQHPAVGRVGDVDLAGLRVDGDAVRLV